MVFLIALFCLSLFGCEINTSTVGAKEGEPVQLGQVDLERLLNIEAEPGAWLTGGRDWEHSYFSPLKSINKDNVAELGFAWQYEINTTDGFEATPIVVDGVMFASGPRGTVFALDAKTGEARWTFEPEIDQAFVKNACCGVVNRGVAVWKGRVLVASFDGYLYALDANTGAIAWKVDTLTDRSRGYSISGAPYIAKDLVVIGNAGAEYDARGYVTAYDAKTGEQRWRFFTVPGDPKYGFEHPELELAAKTWDPNSLWEVGLGGTVWDGMAYDPGLSLLYVGTGNGGPHAQILRSPAGGDNLFLSSILAINPDTGRLVWYYQETPEDSWDYTATQKMILADLEIDGKIRKVIMHAPKNGFFYVLDRITGDLISADAYTEVTWASHVDMKTRKPVKTAQADYSQEAKLIFPGPIGGHLWQPMAYSAETGLVYVPTFQLPAVFAMPKEPFVYKRGGYNAHDPATITASDFWAAGKSKSKHLPSLEKLARGQPDYQSKGVLKAWDPVKQEVVWEVDSSGPWTGKFFVAFSGGGVMATAGGLVFQGRGIGDLVVLNAATGQQLHVIKVGTSLSAAPMTYSIDGEQYVAIMAGINPAHLPPEESASYRYGNKGRIVAFKLGGGAVPSRPTLDRNESRFTKPGVARRGTMETIERGGKLFVQNCARCHHNAGGGGIPDLRWMTKSTHGEFMDIVMNGSRADKGMGNFSNQLSAEDAEAVHVYLIEEAWTAYEADKNAR